MQIYTSLDEAFRSEMQALMKYGDEASPRGLSTLERTDCAFRLADPRARVIISPSRSWSLPYAIGELLWHLSGTQDLNFISYYSKFWMRISEDHKTITGSCYGAKIFSLLPDGRSMWTALKSLLAEEPDTRRALITLYSSTDLEHASSAKDTPCTCTLQFLLRDGRLNVITYMRSNDIMLGFGYDIYVFTMLQEIMSLELGVDLGWYQHIVGSLHLYGKDFEVARKVLAEQVPCTRNRMEKMSRPDQLIKVLDYEKMIRESINIEPYIQFEVDKYWSDMLLCLLHYKFQRQNKTKYAKIVINRLKNSSFHELLVNFFQLSISSATDYDTV